MIYDGSEQHTAVVHVISAWRGKESLHKFYNAEIAQECVEDMQYLDGLVCWVEYLTPVVR